MGSDKENKRAISEEMFSVKIKKFKKYTDERFPILKNGIFILIFTLSAYIFAGFVYESSITGLKTGAANPLVIKSYLKVKSLFDVISLFIVVFFFFFQLRIIDEFKDYEEDLKYRPYRPVQRGLVTLSGLRNIGIFTAIAQIILLLSIGIIGSEIMLFLLAIVWLYMYLMYKEFFIKEWIKKRVLIYAMSHVVIMILMCFIPVYGRFLNLGTENFISILGDQKTKALMFRWELICFYLVSYMNGIVLEIGRKTRREDEEEHGVETYSKLWGREKASIILCIFYFIEHMLIAVSLFQLLEIRYFMTSLIFLTSLLLFSLYLTKRFYTRNMSGKVVETASAIWITGSYILLGILQMILMMFL